MSVSIDTGTGTDTGTDTGSDTGPDLDGGIDGGVVEELDLGGLHSCARHSSGAIRCWGDGQLGQLGQGSTDDIGDDETPATIADPEVGGEVIQVSAGRNHTCVLLTGGIVRCFGNGGNGELGYGDNATLGDDTDEMPTGDVTVGVTVDHVEAGGYHSCALTADDAVRCWGAGGYGQLGSEDTANASSPGGDLSLGGTVVGLAAGSHHNCAIIDGGTLKCWGSGFSGRLGYGNTDAIGDGAGEMPPADVAVGGTVLQVAAGSSHTCALISGGAIRCWGAGGYGRLGSEDTDNIGDGPSEMPPTDVSLGATAIAVGDDHTCVLLDTGAVRCWGVGTDGCLGYSDTADIGDNELPSTVGPVSIW